MDAIAPSAVLQAPPAGVWRQAWHRFRRNRAGMLGLVLVALVVLTALASGRCWRRTSRTTNPPC